MQDKATTTMEGRALAIAAGCVFLLGTLGILFEDVIGGAPPSLKHGLTLVTLVGTIMAGHLANSSRASRQFFSAVGFTLVFLAGTGLVVYSSVGRQAASSVQTTGQIEEANERRADIKRQRAETQAMLDTAYFKYAKQCETGKGPRCDGIEATINAYEAAVAGHNAKLDKLGVQKPAAPEAEQFAEIAAVLFGADKAKVKAGALLVVPFLITLFLEFGTIVSLGYGLKSSPRPYKLPAPTLPVPVALEPVPKGGGDGPATKAEALDDLQRLLKRGHTIESQDELVQRYGVAKGTISKWLREWEDAGEIPARSQVGKFKQIAA